MKFSMRVKVASVLAVFMVMAAGSAWAQSANDVVQAITNFGLARKAGETGNTITVVNNSSNPLEKDTTGNSNGCLLNLGDITGLNIDWKANLTVTGEAPDVPNETFAAILFSNGTFNITGGTIDLQTTGNAYSINAIEGKESATVTVDGGTLQGAGASHFGITADSGGAKVIVKNGKVSFPNGGAISAYELTVNNPSVITGLAFDDSSGTERMRVYGTVNTAFEFNFDNPKYNILYEVKNGATWTVRSNVLNLASETYRLLVEKGGKMIIEGNTTVNIRGTLINKGSFINYGTINNYSSNTLDNQGELTNNGTIHNTNNGTFTNDGTFTNNGTFTNDGTFIPKPGSKLAGKGDINGANAGEVTSGIESSGSGGCNAGFGLFGLLLAGFVMRGYRKV